MMSAHGTHTGYERLRQLAELGDKGAARELLREALRRSDWEVYGVALEVLSPGMGLSEATHADNLSLTDDNLDAFARLEMVVGDLEICLAEREDLGVLVRLRGVSGRVLVRECGRLRALVLPNLAEVQALEIAENAALEHIELPALASVDFEVQVLAHDRLNTVRMDALTRCTELEMRHSPELHTLSLQRLERASIRLESLEAIHALAFPSLVQADQFSVSECGVLALVSLPELARIGGQFEIAAVLDGAVLDAPRLHFASFVRLGEGGMVRARLPALAEVDALCIRSAKGTDARGNLRRGEVEVEGELALPALTKIRQSLRVEHEPTLQALLLPELKELGDFSHPTALRINNTALKVVSMPALQKMSGAFEVTDNPDLTIVRLPMLTFLFGAFKAERNGVGITRPAFSGSPLTIDPLFRSDFKPNLVFQPVVHRQTGPGWGALIFFVAILAAVLLGLWSGVISPGRSALRGFPSAYDLNILNIKVPHLAPETHALLSHSLGRLMAVSAKMQSRMTQPNGAATGSLCDRMAQEKFNVSTGDVDARTLLSSKHPAPACVRGNLRICNLDHKSLPGLEQIHAVEGDVEICDNPHLENLNDLNGLSVIEGHLTITRNAALFSLSGLRIDMLDGNARVTNNPTLNICDAAQFPANALHRLIASDNAPSSLCATEALRPPPR